MIQKFGLYFLIAFVAVSCKNNSSESDNVQEPVGTAFVKVVEPNKFKSLLEADASSQLVDVRTANEVADGVVSGAMHMCFTCPEFEDQIEELDKDLPVFVYCKVGGRSSRAAAVLKRKGFTKIYDLKGGIDAWQEEGFELDLFRRKAE